jgi:hypothetical protein
MKKEYYTYAYLREDKTPWYIGKGKNRRAYQKHDFFSPPPKNRILILKKNLTENQAYKHEIYMINVFGRKDLGTGILRNRSDGGESPPIFTGHTEESKERIRKSCKGRVLGPGMSDEGKKRKSQYNKDNGIKPPLYVKPFKLLSPTGKIFEGNNINQFCLLNNLNPDAIYSLRRGKQKQHRGWRLV